MPTDGLHAAAVTFGVWWLYWRAYKEKPFRRARILFFRNRRQTNAD